MFASDANDAETHPQKRQELIRSLKKQCLPGGAASLSTARHLNIYVLNRNLKDFGYQATAAAALAFLGDFRARGSAVFAPFGAFTITSINAFCAST